MILDLGDKLWGNAFTQEYDYDDKKNERDW